MMAHHIHVHRRASVEVSGEGDCMYLPPLCGSIGALRHCRHSQFHRLGPFDVLRHRRFPFYHRYNFVYFPLQPSTKYLYISICEHLQWSIQCKIKLICSHLSFQTQNYLQRSSEYSSWVCAKNCDNQAWMKKKKVSCTNAYKHL